MSSSPLLVIASEAVRTILTESGKTHPQEACGLLFGRHGRIERASIARNVSPVPWRAFEIDPAHLFDAHRKARETDMPILGCWHSHPDENLVPSNADLAGATQIGWFWLISSSRAIAAFERRDEGFIARPLAQPPPPM